MVIHLPLSTGKIRARSSKLQIQISEPATSDRRRVLGVDLISSCPTAQIVSCVSLMLELESEASSFFDFERPRACASVPGCLNLNFDFGGAFFPDR